MAAIIHPVGTDIPATDAYEFARHHGVEDWFDAFVIHPRTGKDRVEAGEPLKQREADRFQRLQLLIERATQAFGDESKALGWLTRAQYRFGGSTPLDCAAWERNFLAVLDHLIRIEHGIYA
ncbi:antitoxin Xre/MbcA/ParS toxin-binding domain-containing protein [Salinisphaera aquimarina]|uniref:Antitoxin Xre/MbcA/ParS toxin-binding domain-containing protein n=1 Tax=Salinisphaera aquimarina TaxID=2094031 RepID=A0ABV7ET27_9GAMM